MTLIEVLKTCFAKIIVEQLEWLKVVFQAIAIVCIVILGFIAVVAIGLNITGTMDEMQYAKSLETNGWNKVVAHNSDYVSAELLARKKFEDAYDKCQWKFISTNVNYNVFWKAMKNDD